jgi:toxin ParE1/3/4
VKLRFTPRATRDLAEIAEYLRTYNPSAALTVRAAILRSLQKLTLFPEIGRPKMSKASANSWRRNIAILSIT